MLSLRIGLSRLCIATALGSALGACSEEERAKFVPGDGTPITPTVNLDPCARPNTGCACEEEGEDVDCGSVVTQHDDYVTCTTGTRTCTDGVWGECLGARRTQEIGDPDGDEATSSTGLRFLANGTSSVCPPGFDVCDPYCNQVVDPPSGFVPPSGFESGSDGLTLKRTTSATPCTSLTISPASPTITVTSLSPLTVSNSPLALSVTASPAACQTGPFSATWAVDKVDRASITGTTSANGSLTVAAALGGTLRVTVFGLGLSTYRDIPVKVSADGTTAATSTSPANQSGSSYLASFTGAGSVNSTATFLYPYQDTYFPLGLQAPVVQYSYSTTTGNGKGVKVTLRYPSGKAYGDSSIQFNYSFVVKEANVVAAGAGVPTNVLDPQVVIPQAAWKAFERTARGDDADIIVQRLTGSLERELAQRIHFVDGQLKGTVYYNSYNSTIGGSTSTNVFGAVLKIRPEQTQPTNAVPYVSGASNPDGLKTNGVCTVCHSVSAKGNTLAFMSGYTNGAGCYNSYQSGSNYRGNACAFTLDSAGAVDWITTYRSDDTTKKQRLTWGAPYPDGSFYLTNAWDNVESFEQASTLTTTATGATLTGTAVPPLAVTPVFSADGRVVAYNDGTDGRIVISEYNPCKRVNGTSTGEFVEVRNDSLVSVDVSGWTVRRSTGAVCFTVPNNTTLASGKASSPIEISGACLSDTSDTISLYDKDDGLRHSRVYSYAACRREMFSCPTGSWTNSTTMTETTSNETCTITATNDVSTTKLKAKTFGCGASTGSVTCGGSSAKTFSSERTVVDCSATGVGCVTAGNPSFLPDARGLLYQHVTTAPATSATNGGDLTVASRLNTWQGAQAEVWLANSVQSPSWAPKRLFALNGLTSAGVNYLPLKPRTVSVPTGYDNKFHDGSGASGWVYDRCSGNSGLIAATVNENKLNYVPTVAPQEAGGKYWVIFTSRRLYGSVAISSPWQTERSNDSSNLFGPFNTSTANCASLDQYSPGSGLIETKKLWIAAVDKDWETTGLDPSHPAFYLPGQELDAGNSHGFWVSDACGGLNATCETNDDCCLGTGTDPERQCKVVSTATVPATKQCAEITDCSESGESCSTTNDCCAGLTCPAGGGVCVLVPPVAYQKQTLTREYEASCPADTQVEWRFFEWQATIPTGTSIAFSAQAKASAAATALPVTPIPIGTALPSSAPDASETWFRGTSTVGALLSASSATALVHAPNLVVTFEFFPDSTGQVAPTLHGWQQLFDCLPAQ